jgi:hypothetical protein
MAAFGSKAANRQPHLRTEGDIHMAHLRTLAPWLLLVGILLLALAVGWTGGR